MNTAIGKLTKAGSNVGVKLENYHNRHGTCEEDRINEYNVGRTVLERTRKKYIRFVTVKAICG
jgi:hypothetical protein